MSQDTFQPMGVTDATRDKQVQIQEVEGKMLHTSSVRAPIDFNFQQKLDRIIN